jgi:DNA replication protein DnaC
MTTENLLLDSHLKRLHLPTVEKNYERVAEEAVQNNISHLSFLRCLLDLEIQHRDYNAQRQRLRRAGFPSSKDLERFDFTALPNINKSLILELSRGAYLKEFFNIIFLGNIGTGKTHLATSFGTLACQQGHSVKYCTVAGLATELLEAHDERRLAKMKQQLAKVELLILDELGMVPFHKDAANLLFQVINDRYERKSTIITTNLEFSNWTQVFGAAPLTAALLDRLTHRCHIIEMNGDSYRFKESMKRKKKHKTDA